MADLKDWSTNDSDNGALSAPDGANSGWTGSQVGPWARRTMSTVAEWYKDPAWVNPMENISDLGDKTVVRTGDNTVRVSSNTGGSIATSATDYFPVGRMIRLTVQGGSTKIHAFVISATVSGATPALNLTLALLNQSTIAGGTNFVNNGIEVYGGQSAETTANDLQALGSVAFSGIGTTTERDSRFPMSLTNYPDGLLWFDTTTDLMQVKRSASWLDFATFDDRLDDKGRVLRVEANDISATGDASLYLLSKRGSTAQLRGYERNSADTEWDTRGIIYFDNGGEALIMEGPRKDDDGNLDTFNRIYLYGAGADAIGGSADRRGKLWYTRIGWTTNAEGEDVTTTLQSSNFTPGELDAGTLNDLTANEIVERSLHTNAYQWDMSGGSHPAGDGSSASHFVLHSTGTAVELARFAFPSDLIEEIGIGNTVKIDFNFAISGFSNVNGNTNPSVESDTNANHQVALKVYVGENYGSSSQSISGFPLGTNETIRLRAHPTTSNGRDVWATFDGTETQTGEITVTANLGFAVAVYSDNGQNWNYYSRVNTSVPAVGSRSAATTMARLYPVRKQVRTNSWTSEAQ